MTDTNDDSFRSIAGAPESAEPASTLPLQAPAPSIHDNSANRASTGAAASDSAPSAPMRHQTLNGSRSLNASGSPSTANSPMSSRDTSPARPPQRTTTGPLPKSGLRSRKSSTDVSPNRGPSLAGSSNTVPSAAAIQRALSSATMPQLPPASTQDPSRVPRPLKSGSGGNSGETTPHWPISPRLKSPPPSADARSRSRRNSLRSQVKKPESSSTPAIVVQSSSPAPTSRIPVKDEVVNSDQEEPAASMKTSSRGASGAAPKLETVQESSLPATPGSDGLDVQSFPSISQVSKPSDDEQNDVSSSKVTEDLSAKNTKQNESGSDSGTKNDTGKMQEQRSASTQRPNALPSKSSFTSLSTNKSRTEAPSRNMTVETETVPSIAQATISNQDRSASGRGEGSLRLKPSNETIRPKKERKIPKAKARSINSGTGRSPRVSYYHYCPSRPDTGPRSMTASSLGSPITYRSYDDRRSVVTMSPPSSETIHRRSTRSPSIKYFYSNTNPGFRKASSKADVFEQKVASAVDEANSSDSDATFIYESNPPDQQPHRSRHHSRTPSMTSIASLVDPRMAIRDAHKNPGKKSSMKFGNAYNHPNADGDTIDRGDGTMRVGSGRISGGSHHHHIGRHGQGRGALSHLVMDSDSSMPQSSRARGPSSRHPSQPNSPRFQTFNIGNGNGNGNKKHGEYSSYDIDTENAADDERTPLISSVRSPRVRTPRRRNSATLRHLERRHRRNGGWCRRFAGCLVLSILLLVVIFMSVGLVFATTKPLSDLEVRDIQNVVASQEEIILDLIVDAVNPNIIGVTVADMDVIIFAKSKHVGSDKWWREHGNGGPQDDNEEDWHPIKASETEHGTIVTEGIDEGTDPIEDPDVGEPRTMSLGHIFHFESPLNFDGSFFKRRPVQSVGEIRLPHPGNKTEAGGTERWEEVLQYPFELIVRGNLKYQLPLSTREHKVSIIGSYYYDPDLEKKKLKALETEKLQEKKKKKLLSQPVTPKPLGRYDRRAIPLLGFDSR